MKTLSREEIGEILPHSGRALMLDKVEIIEDKERPTARGYLLVTPEHCEGHFPGNPIMRGVDRVEVAALTLCVLGMHNLTEPALMLFLSYGETTFSGLIRPGDTLVAEVTITEQNRRRMVGDAVLTVNDKVVCRVTRIEGGLVSPRAIQRAG